MPLLANRSKLGVLTYRVPYALACPMSSATAKRMLGRGAAAPAAVPGPTNEPTAISTMITAAQLRRLLLITRPTLPSAQCTGEAANWVRRVDGRIYVYVPPGGDSH